MGQAFSWLSVSLLLLLFLGADWLFNWFVGHSLYGALHFYCRVAFGCLINWKHFYRRIFVADTEAANVSFVSSFDRNNIDFLPATASMATLGARIRTRSHPRLFRMHSKNKIKRNVITVSNMWAYQRGSTLQLEVYISPIDISVF